MGIGQFLRQRFGFTRNEIVVSSLLTGALLAGTAVRTWRDVPMPHRIGPYTEVDSQFARDARAFHDALRAAQPVSRHAATRTPVNINTAGTAELIALPGIGPTMARRIVDHRTAHGPFASVDELTHVRGIGPATLRKLRPLVHTGPVRTAPQRTARP